MHLIVSLFDLSKLINHAHFIVHKVCDANQGQPPFITTDAIVMATVSGDTIFRIANKDCYDEYEHRATELAVQSTCFKSGNLWECITQLLST